MSLLSTISDTGLPGIFDVFTGGVLLVVALSAAAAACVARVGQRLRGARRRLRQD